MKYTLNEKAASFNTEIFNTTLRIVEDTSNPLYKIPIFLSYATPYNKLQVKFLSEIIKMLKLNLLFPRTLGTTDQYTETNLTSIRRMILSTYGMISIAFNRIYIKKAIALNATSNVETFKNFWVSSPYLQIEPAMAYQHGLPLMVMIERNFRQNITQNSNFGGIYAANSLPLNIIVVDISTEKSIAEFFNSAFWNESFMDWIGQVRNAYTIQTEPDFKYEC
ncbi:hypothetical protein SAMN02745134_03365 [Clostridium acidisoli DSM 12555]|jgi:hypothetical protein|uniref:Uncharacterized protein n=1 Tax=Clostridium acidisoli DSM 12555 TaxID=1121291 RepID=A0A1W1XVN8_9CLOT|nr:hypothetical protein [Clostridium acidisoli]SMC27986.1 hypothetical protein SAMN02745134_03365 [Clostridium acidisoli DSM 12555]